MISTFRERTDKPHIFFNEGYWRVSLSKLGVHSRLKPWHKAHEFIRLWNSVPTSLMRLHMAWCTASSCECTEVDYCDNCLEKMSRDNSSTNEGTGIPEGVRE